MNDPTFRLIAYVASIVMCIVCNIVNIDPTIVCTIRHPIIDIFESFDDVNSNTFMINLYNGKKKDIFMFLCVAFEKEKWFKGQE